MILGLFSLTAQAEKFGVNIDGKNIEVTDVSTGGDDILISKQDLSDGIYIAAVSGPFAKVFPNATTVIRSRFTEAGFKVVDKADGAALGIQFFSGGDLDMEDANEASAHSVLPSSSNAGAAIASVVSGGLVGGVGFVAILAGVDNKAVMSGFSLHKPIDEKMFKSHQEKDAQFNNRVTVKYVLDKKDKASEDVILKMVVDQYIKQYFKQ